jgi:hypothetical protein
MCRPNDLFEDLMESRSLLLMVYSTAMSLAQNRASSVDMMINDYRSRKDIVGSGDGHTAVLNWYLPGKIRKTTKTSVMTVAGALGRDSKQTPPEWKSESLSLGQNCSVISFKTYGLKITGHIP